MIQIIKRQQGCIPDFRETLSPCFFLLLEATCISQLLVPSSIFNASSVASSLALLLLSHLLLGFQLSCLPLSHIRTLVIILNNPGLSPQLKVLKLSISFLLCKMGIVTGSRIRMWASLEIHCSAYHVDGRVSLQERKKKDLNVQMEAGMR